MRRLTTITATASVAVGGLLLGGALLPAGAATTDPEPGTSAAPDAADGKSFLAERLTRLKEALAGLVDDGTLTQDQADAVARTLDESDALGPRGFGGGFHDGAGPVALDSAAEALGLTEAEVLEALRAGTSLADLAEEQGVDVATLVDALVAAASARLDEAVAAGDLDQARAEELKSGLEERLTDAVEQVPGAGRGMGPGMGSMGPGMGSMGPGMGHHGGWGDDDDAVTEDSADAATLWGPVTGRAIRTV